MPPGLEDPTSGATFVLGTDERAGRRRTETWQELSRGPDDLPLPEERPDLTITLTVSRSSVPFRVTYAEAFGVMRGIFMREGTEGVAAFLRANEMVARRTRGREGVETTEPDEFLPPERRAAYRLLSTARTRVERIADEHVRALEPLLAAEATARLRAGHAQIQEGLRYLRGPGVAQQTPFDDRVPASVFGLASNEAGDGLVAELRRCRELLAAAGVSAQRLHDARLRATPAAVGRVGPFAFVAAAPVAGATPVTNTLAVQAVAQAVAADPAVIARTSEDDEARNRLQEQLTLAGLEHPVLFQIYREADPEDRDAVARRVVEALRRADGANHRLITGLADDAAIVWQFPAAVREGLAEVGVPETSVTWVAAEERLAREQGPRLAAQLGMVSGLAAGGAALLGAAVAPPLAVAIVVADVVVNLVDALQEYLSYRRLRAGFDAVLDPSLALGAEPGLLGTVLTIAFDLASALPVPGGRAAAAAVP